VLLVFERGEPRPFADLSHKPIQILPPASASRAFHLPDVVALHPADGQRSKLG
jgi:hypothetical protein